MTRNVSLVLMCTAIFLSLTLVTASAEGEELPGLDVYVIGQHAYVAGGSSGLYVVDISRPAKQKVFTQLAALLRWQIFPTASMPSTAPNSTQMDTF